MSSESPRPAPIVSVPQTLAGAGAAVTAAVAGSTLGVAGTFIGAAIASVVSTVAAALYSRSLQRASERLATLPAKAPVSRPGVPRPSLPTMKGMPSLSTLPRKRLAIVAAALFVGTIAVVTVTEGVIGRPISAAVTGNEATGTSLGQLGQGNVGAPRPSGTRTTTPTETDSGPAPGGTSPSPGTRSPAPDAGTSGSEAPSEESGSPAEEAPATGGGGTGGTGGGTGTGTGGGTGTGTE